VYAETVTPLVSLWSRAGNRGLPPGCGSAAGAHGREARTLDAICDQLIPSDQDPGAAAAGAVVFIDRQLAGPYAPLPARLPRRSGASRCSQPQNVRQTADELAGDQRLAVVTRLEKEARPFFEMVLAHTMQGFYGSPRHGGNRDYTSWRMLRVPASPVRGRIQYDLRQGKA
jgi:gluconate 2-dehydrogenase gamma chain